MAKPKTRFQCNECGAVAPKWTGQCTDCGAWNSLVETTVPSATSVRARFRAVAASDSTVTSLSDAKIDALPRVRSGSGELDRAVGGGLVPGSIVLIGGDPGIGKSTLLIQVLSSLATDGLRTLYVSAEESAGQIAMRAERLGLPRAALQVLAENRMERILSVCAEERPQALVVDSIQTVYTDWLQSAPGAVGQVRECAAQLVRFAKETDSVVFLVGHVTKEGALAGPRVLEHMVDTVLYFEGESSDRHRVIRAVKNRFGAVNELGVFAMTDRGLREVSNPSAIFLAGHEQPVSGSVIMVTREGTRPFLVEVQALVDGAMGGYPRRVTVGLDSNRLAMLLAVLHRHVGIATSDQDVFVNVVGGVRITETAADLAVLLAVMSSLRDRPIPRDLVVFGETGLSGEIRPVQSGMERLKEAAKHGFRRAVIPRANRPKGGLEDMQLKTVQRLAEVLDGLFD
ncbi:MAG: DNA repair protein RadA [Gammaproteobacteria bacterium]|nr:DNA repair protein RadA [Gammaproteobacteria bacterium]